MIVNAAIYKISNNKDGHVYVGSATNPTARWIAHQYRLRNNNHHSIRLQRAWNRDGELSFSFSIIEMISAIKSQLKEKMIEREQFWIDALGGYGLLGYNMSPTASSSLGVIRSPEYRAKQSASRTGRKTKPASEERKRKIALAHLGKPKGPMSEAHKLAISLSLKGKKVPVERAARISIAHRGRIRGPMSEAHKEAIRQAQLKKREEYSARAKARWQANDPTFGRWRKRSQEPELF